MYAFWNRLVYKDLEAKHVCEDFAVVLCCNGEKDLMMCRKCGNGWIAPCHKHSKVKKREVSAISDKDK